jgi:DNA/RNA-binding domain of Phe-tRNA-synthetase-like protein
MRSASNPASCPELQRSKQELEQRLRARFGPVGKEGIRATPTLRAYDAYYRRFGKTYHVQLQLESLVLKGRSIPGGLPLVEAMFMAELEDLLLTAGHDLDALRLPIVLDVAAGTERYTLLNGQEQVLKPGDMCMADPSGVISSVLYGPDQRTRITAATRSVLFAVYAPAGIGADAVREHLQRITANVRLITPQATAEEQAVYQAPLRSGRLRLAERLD